MGKSAKRSTNQRLNPLLLSPARPGRPGSRRPRVPAAVQPSAQWADGPVDLDDMDLDNNVDVPTIQVCAMTQDEDDAAEAAEATDGSSDITLEDAGPTSRSASNFDHRYGTLVHNRDPQTRSRLGINDETYQTLVENKKLLLSQWTHCSDLGDDSEGQYISRVAASITPTDYSNVPDEELVETVKEDLEPLEISNFYKQETHFLPWTALHKVLSTHTVLRILQHLNTTGKHGRFDEELREMAGKVAPPLANLKTGQDMNDQYRRVFGTLILVSHGNRLRHEEGIFKFYDLKLNDGRLLADIKFDGHKPASENPLINDLFFGWSPRNIKEFKEYRWSLSPKLIAVKEVIPADGERKDGIIEAKRMQYNLRSPEEILPFKNMDRGSAAGGFADVRFLILHEDQQAIPRYTRRGRDNPIAVKTLNNDAKGTNQQKMAYHDEAYIMDRLNSSTTTPHITKLLATIVVASEHPGSGRSDYHLILEAADRNLEQLWRSQQWWDQYPARGITDLDLHRWVACQCYGLADALWRFHDFCPREGDMSDKNHLLHCDIKPDNILHYEDWKEDPLDAPRGTVHKDLGVLQLGDFGLSSFHSTRSVDKHWALGAFLDYAAPETEVELRHSPAAEVWHLGCLFIDFATWLLHGPKGYDAFLGKRMTKGLRGDRSRFATFTPTTKDGRIKNEPLTSQRVSPTSQEEFTRVDVNPEVLVHATKLCEDARSSPFVRELCHLAVNYMLVMRATDQPHIEVEYSQEPTEVKDRLKSSHISEILQKMMEKGDDFFMPTPEGAEATTPFDLECWKRPSLVYQYSVQTLRTISHRVHSGLEPEEAGLEKPGFRVVNKP